MNQLTNTISPASVPALPDEWAERIFQRMENFYLAKWVDSFGSIPRERVKRAWAEELAGYSAQEIKNGLEACRSKVWPPSLPEFLILCRPVIDARTDWSEACEQMRIRLQGRGEDRWSRPQVYWAAVAVGAYDLNALAWEQIRGRWERALTDARTDPIPEYRAQLPAPGAQTVTRVEAASRMSALRARVGAPMPGTTPVGTMWAIHLMKREAGGEQLSAIGRGAWREALGYAGDADAKAVLQAHLESERAAA